MHTGGSGGHGGWKVVETHHAHDGNNVKNVK